MIYFLIVSLIIALLRGGSLLRLGELQIRHAYLIPLGLGLELFRFSPWAASFEPWIGYLYPTALAILLLAVVLNWELPGFKILGMGLFLNFLVITANGGYMPISTEAVRRAGLLDLAAALEAAGRYRQLIPMGEGTWFWFLGDIIVLGYPLPQFQVFSPGDILVAGGAFCFLQWAMLGPRWIPGFLEKPLARLPSLGQTSLIWGALPFLLGLLTGWLLIGWLLWPVEYYDTDPPDLRLGHKENYLSLVAESYSLNQDEGLARERLEGFSQEEIERLLSHLVERYEEAGDLVGAQRVRDLACGVGLPAFSSE